IASHILSSILCSLPRSTLFPYTTLFRSLHKKRPAWCLPFPYRRCFLFLYFSSSICYFLCQFPVDNVPIVTSRADTGGKCHHPVCFHDFHTGIISRIGADLLQKSLKVCLFRKRIGVSLAPHIPGITGENLIFQYLPRHIQVKIRRSLPQSPILT